MHRCRWHIFTIKALLCLSIFLYISQWHVTQQKHTEWILVFPWQQWLSKRATTLRNTCTAYLARLPLFCTNITQVTHKHVTSENQPSTATNPSETLLNLYDTTRRHNRKSINLQLYVLLTQVHIYSFLYFVQDVKSVKAQKEGYIRPPVPRRRIFSELHNGFRLSL